MTGRRRRTVENGEFRAMLGRMIRAYGSRVEDTAELAEMVEIRDDVERAIRVAVERMRADHSWAEIGAALGVSKQAAQSRYGN